MERGREGGRWKNKKKWKNVGSFRLVAVVFELFGSCHPPVDQ